MAEDAEDVTTRVLHAIEREINAHQRAIVMQEAAAKDQLRLGHPERAAAASRRAERARHLLTEAHEELQRFQKSKLSRPKAEKRISTSPDSSVPG